MRSWPLIPDLCCDLRLWLLDAVTFIKKLPWTWDKKCAVQLPLFTSAYRRIVPTFMSLRWLEDLDSKFRFIRWLENLATNFNFVPAREKSYGNPVLNTAPHLTEPGWNLLLCCLHSPHAWLLQSEYNDCSSWPTLYLSIPTTSKMQLNRLWKDELLPLISLKIPVFGARQYLECLNIRELKSDIRFLNAADKLLTDTYLIFVTWNNYRCLQNLSCSGTADFPLRPDTCSSLEPALPVPLLSTTLQAWSWVESSSLFIQVLTMYVLFDDNSHIPLTSGLLLGKTTTLISSRKSTFLDLYPQTVLCDFGQFFNDAVESVWPPTAHCGCRITVSRWSARNYNRTTL